MFHDTSPQLVACPNCGTGNPSDARFCGECGREQISSTPKVGQVIAERYRITELLGRGGMGVVYTVEHVQIGKKMAMKILHGELNTDSDTLTRFHREAEAASKLSHPNTVQVFDFGRSAGGWMYLVMEYVDGPDWGKVLDRDGAMSFEKVAHITAQVAASVHEAHQAGIVHRDLKPENVVITQGPDGDMAKVLDFGLAKLREGSAYGKATQTGAIIGTPYYMSPEQIRGEDLDGRSDVYALGALMYMAVVGDPPFDAQSPIGVLTKHLTEAPVPVSDRTPAPITPQAEAIIMRAMDKDIDKRYPTADALREDLLDYLASPLAHSESLPRRIRSLSSKPPIPKPKRSMWRWALLGFAILSLSAGVFAWTRPLDENEPNNARKRANRLPESEWLQGHLGRRLDANQGDVDYYQLEYRAKEPTHARIEVTEIPNMDLVLQVMRKGSDTPLATSNAGGVGQGELIANFPLVRGGYSIRIQEIPMDDQLPTENVSDSYTIRWEAVARDEASERESNDSLELAEKLSVDDERRGWIGWTGDVDTYCLAEDTQAMVAQLGGVLELDLILRVVDREQPKSYKIDNRGVGKGESSRLIRNSKADKTCVEVSAKPSGKGKSSSPQPYTIRFLAK